MASIVPGYEYDIIISYLQKDNKDGMWMGDFVEASQQKIVHFMLILHWIHKSRMP